MNFTVSPLWAYADYFWPAVMVVAAFWAGYALRVLFMDHKAT